MMKHVLSVIVFAISAFILADSGPLAWLSVAVAMLAAESSFLKNLVMLPPACGLFIGGLLPLFGVASDTRMQVALVAFVSMMLVLQPELSRKKQPASR